MSSQKSRKAESPIRIAELRISNVKRISAVDITPVGNGIVIGGENGAGKSSVLDSIAYCLGGAKLCPSHPIKKGRKSAEVTVELSNGYSVTRKWTSAGSTLHIWDSSGEKLPSPQRILDEMIGALSFDPLEFINAHPTQQVAMLKALVGLDFTDLDADRAKMYCLRADINREAKDKKALRAFVPEYPDAPDQEVDPACLMDQLQKLLDAGGERRNVEALCENSEEVIKRTEGVIKDLEKRLAHEKKLLAAEKKTLAAASKKLASMPVYDPEAVEATRTKIRGAAELNRQVQSNKQLAALEDEITALTKQSRKLTQKMEAIDDKKAEMLENAEFPVPDMYFDEEIVYYQKVPLDQASSAEKLRVSVAVGIKFNPKLGVMLIRDGSLLDKANLEMIYKMAAEADIQIWIERVGEEEITQVIIEDGAVKGADDAINEPASI
jgi:hypothetical protein